MPHAVSRQEKPVAQGHARHRTGAVAERPAKRHAGDSSVELGRAFELAALLESAGDAVVGVSPAGLISGWGEGAQRLFGYLPREATGQPVAMLAPSERSHEARSLIDRVLSGAPIERVETVRVTKDGTVLNVLLSVAPIWSEEHELAGAVGIYRDLSAQRSAEDALQASEQRYHSVVEALSEGVVMQDRDGRILASNASAERILGLSASELSAGSTHRPANALMHEDGSELRVEEHPSILALRTGDPQREVVVGIDGNGPTMRWISVSASPLVLTGESEPYATVSSFTDITETRRILAELHEARFEDLRRLALMAEYRDDDTNKHTERVAHACALLATELGLDSELVQCIRRAAPLHDVGKVGIPDEILLKPGELTLEEFEVIKTHTVIGGRILSKSRFPVVKMAMEIAFTHHERWDGSGYPSGLRGEGIPISGRIVAVADAFDAMTHARPYKAALPVEYAVTEIQRCRSSQFDPRVVDAFMRLDHSALVDASCV
jgi:PAS domain S-box-containing protein/putative nucleotidyltransferase with HDIG domain